ncbi:MAG: hypothetical protein KDB90_17605 [Planctomycetes bacterium]|nr:hypothetical protein [Planctomycetota bacterium]
MFLATSLRSARATDIVVQAGAGAKWLLYSGAVPAAGGALSGNTLLATLTAGATIGTVSNGVLTIGAITQTNANHVNGTPTFARLVTSGDVLVGDFSIPGDLSWSGQVANGFDVAWSGTITEGNQS